MGLKRRIEKLAGGGHRYAPDDCPEPPQLVLRVREGEPPPPVPPDLSPCRLCGGTHVLEVVEVVVKNHAEAVSWLARMRGEDER